MQIESECLNLNINCPGFDAGVPPPCHGLDTRVRSSSLLIPNVVAHSPHPVVIIVETIVALDLIDSTMEDPSCRIASG